MFLIGRWNNFDELEDNLTLDELNAILETQSELDMNNKRFAASLKGINLDEYSSNDRFEEIERRALAKARGMSKEKFELESFGISLESEDEAE